MSATATKQPKPKKPAKPKAANPAKPRSKKQKTDSAPPPPNDPVLIEIEHAEAELTKAERDYEEKKSQAKEAKERVEQRRNNLRETIKDARNGQATLFAGTNPAAPSTNGTGHHGPTETGDSRPADDETWRPVKLSSLSIPKGLVSKLAEKNLITVGDYCDYMQPSGNGWTKQLTDVPGIGEAAVTKIEAAIENFFAEHRANVASQQSAAGEQVETFVEGTELPDDEGLQL